MLSATNKSIFGLGAGRMGYSLRAFIMRLSHLGYNAYMLATQIFQELMKAILL